MDWYESYCQDETLKVASLGKEAGDISSLALAVALSLFGGFGVAEAANQVKVPVKAVESGSKNPNILNEARKIDMGKLRGLSNEGKKKYIDDLLGRKTTTPVNIKTKLDNAPKKSPSSKSEMSTSEVLARTIYAEAEGESYEGKKAVASVVYNRAGGDPGKFVGVIKAPKQFSCWNSGAPAKGNGAAWDDSVKIAEEMIGGKFSPNTEHTHYYNPDKVTPKWSIGVDKQRIGNHLFLTPK